ncbi:hypothetical protein DFH06DRAFT_1145761 [Mycena polygramma]|nr:hypothetical protein DFH06DRAFT_1145761 [Mycena polygramma]
MFSACPTLTSTQSNSSIGTLGASSSTSQLGRREAAAIEISPRTVHIQNTYSADITIFRLSSGKLAAKGSMNANGGCKWRAVDFKIRDRAVKVKENNWRGPGVRNLNENGAGIKIAKGLSTEDSEAKSEGVSLVTTLARKPYENADGNWAEVPPTALRKNHESRMYVLAYLLYEHSIQLTTLQVFLNATHFSRSNIEPVETVWAQLGRLAPATSVARWLNMFPLNTRLAWSRSGRNCGS